jgi:hypothetical protein
MIENFKTITGKECDGLKWIHTWSKSRSQILPQDVERRQRTRPLSDAP